MTKMTSSDYKVLYEAQVAIVLTDLMCRALENMDFSLAKSVEEIAANLEYLNHLSGRVQTPFETNDMTEVLISDYIRETSEGAKEDDDFIAYIPGFAMGRPGIDEKGRPSLEKLVEEMQKLQSIVAEKYKKEETEHDEKRFEMMKRDNSKWRDKQS